MKKLFFQHAASITPSRATKGMVLPMQLGVQPLHVSRCIWEPCSIPGPRCISGLGTRIQSRGRGALIVPLMAQRLLPDRLMLLPRQALALAIELKRVMVVAYSPDFPYYSKAR